MAKLPGFMMYPGDWLRDPVSGCSLAAQGLWLRMMFLGHDSGRYGYLVNQDGAPIPAASIAQRCGCSLQQYTALLAELEHAGVPSKSSTAILYSRRMVRDDEKRQMSAERQRNFKKRQKVSNASVTRQSRDSNAFYENENVLVVSNLKSKRKANYEDVKAFCSELKLPDSDSEYLFNHWEGNGWTNGGKPIKDWKRTILAWKAAGILPSQKPGGSKQSHFETRSERTIRLAKENAERLRNEEKTENE